MFNDPAEIESDIRAAEERVALSEEINFYLRSEAIDFIDFHIIDRIDGLLKTAGSQENLIKLKTRAENLKHILECIDKKLFENLREKIRTGIYRDASFKEMIRKYLGNYFNDPGEPGVPGYDSLDVFINGLLSDEPVPQPPSVSQPEMIFYQKTPARIIFELAEKAEIKKDDVFFDIGSGLGQAAILMNLTSGVAVRGIEYEPAYCNYGNTSIANLHLTNIEFINTEARDADYSTGTIFFLYTPFEGSMLVEILEILKIESLKRPIRIFTYGPCSSFVARQHWLCGKYSKADNPAVLYEFRNSFNTRI